MVTPGESLHHILLSGFLVFYHSVTNMRKYNLKLLGWSFFFQVPTRPPGIYVQPPFDVYFKAGETVKLPCIADGNPIPQ